MLDATAPAGTLFDQAQIDRIDGDFTRTVQVPRVATGGPFIIGISTTDGENTESQSLTVNTGQCFGDADSLRDMNAMLAGEDNDRLAVIDCP